MLAQFVVELALSRLHLAVDGLLGLWRQLRATCSLVRRRMNGRSAREQQLAASRARDSASRRRKAEACPQHAGIEKFEERPQLAQVIFDRRAAQRQPVVAAQKADRLGRFGGGVLDGLRLVEDHVVEDRSLKCNASRRSVP